MLAWLLLFPLIGFLVNSFWYVLFQLPRSKTKVDAIFPGAIASLSVFAAFVFAVTGFFKLTSLPPESRFIEEVFFNWISIGGFTLDVSARLDSLSSIFALVVTGVGTLIHVYSIGYMSHDETPTKFFAYLNLFCFSMLVLVLGNSLPVLFFGWEAVGLCSYLLISYWYSDEEKANAGKKAFIVNRIGDFGFLLGMLLIFSAFGTLDIQNLASVVAQMEVAGTLNLTLVTVACLLLFIGCTGKSAQLPLYVWLPDAMAGPTPVSALIHAATMVTAGVYLVSRTHFLFLLSPVASGVIVVVGAATALFAASIAVAQRDIKKILAYSTISQLGYMFMACGVGYFAAGVFHMVTHAFFKALLFLSAGSVIHGMHGEQDVLKMGGLRTKMPRTYLVALAGVVAIAGLPPFSGFFSKDEILWRVLSSHLGGTWLWITGFATALVTTFYMTRFFSLVFLGEQRFDSSAAKKIHESPPVMIWPLYVLAGLSLIGGFFGLPHLSAIEHWLGSTIREPEHALRVSPVLEWLLMLLNTVVVGLVAYGALRYYSNLSYAEKIKNSWKRIYTVLEQKYYIDEICEFLIIKPLRFVADVIWKWIDIAVVDRAVIGVAKISDWAGSTARIMHSGSLHAYAGMFLIGLVLGLGYLIYGLV